MTQVKISQKKWLLFFMIMFVSSFSYGFKNNEPNHENTVKTETSTTPEGFVRIHSASDDTNRENI
jgi:hypothetical protein